jgi:hypothetical protein
MASARLRGGVQISYRKLPSPHDESVCLEEAVRTQNTATFDLSANLYLTD